MGRFTSIHGYSIDVGQYISAGIGFWICGVLFGIFLGKPVVDALKNGIRKVAQVLKVNPSILETGNLFHRLMVIVVIGLYTLVGGSFYGTVIYGRIPHALGGGDPPAIVIVFKDNLSPNQFGLNSVIENSHWSESVYLLAELNDGILVKQPNSPFVTEIRSESYLGLFDPVTFVKRRQEQQSIQAEATPEATDNATPEITDSP